MTTTSSAPRELIKELKSWFQNLSSEQGRELIETNELARRLIQLPRSGNRRVDARKVQLAVLAWTAKARDKQVWDVVSVTGNEVVEQVRGDDTFSAEEIKAPDAAVMRTMLRGFSPVEAGLTVAMLACDDGPGTASAREIFSEVLGWAHEPPPRRVWTQQPPEPSAPGDPVAAPAATEAPEPAEVPGTTEVLEPAEADDEVVRAQQQGETLAQALTAAAQQVASGRALTAVEALQDQVLAYAAAWAEVETVARELDLDVDDDLDLAAVVQARAAHQTALAAAAEAAALELATAAWETELDESMGKLGGIDQLLAQQPDLRVNLAGPRDDLMANIERLHSLLGRAAAAPPDNASPPFRSDQGDRDEPAAPELEDGPSQTVEPTSTPVRVLVQGSGQVQIVEPEPQGEVPPPPAAPPGAVPPKVEVALPEVPQPLPPSTDAPGNDEESGPVSDDELADLVAAGRLDAAYWLARTHGSPAARCEALALLATSASVSGDTPADITPVLLPDALTSSTDPVSILVAQTALLDVALLTGREPGALSQLPPVSEEVADRTTHDLLEAALAAVRQGFRLPEKASASEVGAPLDPAAALAQLAEEVRRLMAEKPRKRLKVARATWVVQDFYRDDGALGSALRLVEQLATAPTRSVRTDLRAFVERYRASSDVERLIEERSVAVVEGRRSYVRLEASPRAALRREVDDAVRIAGTALELTAPRAKQAGTEALGAQVRARAKKVLEDAPRGAHLVEAVVRRFASRIVGPRAGGDEPVRRRGTGPEVETALLLCPGFPRDTDRDPLPDDPAAPLAARALAAGTSLRGAVATHVSTGALDLAAAALEAYGSPEDSSLREAVVDGEREWEQRLRAVRSDAADLLAQLRAQNLLDVWDTTELAGVLEAPPRRDGRHDQQQAALGSVVDRLDETLDQRAAELGAQLEGIAGVSADDRRKVLDALGRRDVATTAEMLALLEGGSSLETAGGEAGDDLQAFSTFLAEHARGGPGELRSVRGLLAAVQATRGVRATDGTDPAIASWEALLEPRTPDDQRRNHLATVLLALGLDAKQTVSPGSRAALPRGVQLYEMRPIPTEEAYVAELGSRSSGTWRVVVLADDRAGRRVLEHVDASSVAVPHVVVYLRTMTPAMRTQVHRDSCERGLNAVVVDAPAFAWVLATAPRSYRALQRIVLPWSGYSPYTPYVSGAVAPEVFAGRRAERSQIMSPDGGTFVYGGRQLGKSALLGRVRDDFSAVGGQHAVMLDLKGLGLGEGEQPSQLWRHLAYELETLQIMPRGRAARATPGYVQQTVKQWLDGDRDRRLLLLLDEADSFLNADSRGGEGAGGVSIFPTVSHLKTLSESTGRRFRVVYAGLHQVQRFSHLPNVLTVHGGPDVPIGPLDPASAVSLVQDPLAALGYRFETPRLVWRLLAFTNYQASLIQIVCAELLSRLRAAAGSSAARRPVSITEKDVEDVLGEPSVRQRVAERLRITINLEDRYRVLALVLAVRGLEDGFHSRYGTARILDEALAVWPEGFEKIKESDLTVYLDELVGLGVLVKDRQGDYSVRSPNVVSMLGTREELEAELDGADFTFAYEYNPLMARRSLTSKGSGTAKSPLTEAELAAVLRAACAGEVPVLTASPLAGPHLFSAAVASVAESRDLAVHPALVEDGSALAVLDVRGSAAAEVTARWSALCADGARAVMVVEPDVVASMPQEARDALVVGRRWTQQGLRAWTETPVDRALLRERLVRATGGWPLLVERALSAMGSGEAVDEVLRRHEDLPGGADEARRLLTTNGIDEDLLSALRPWAAMVEVGDVLRLDDVASATDRTPESTRALLDELDHRDLVDTSSGGFALDPLTHRCLSMLIAP